MILQIENGEKLSLKFYQVIINVSARHVHLKKEHLEVSIGKD